MQLQKLLARPDVHLITILGTGGIGKTRLTLALAEQILSKQDGDKAHPYQHGVCFASLAQLGTADSLLAALAEAVRFSFRDSQDQKEQLLRYLSNRSMLLLLDNFEHLLDGSGLVGRLLLTAPQLQILVTSRERLRLQGEQVYPLQGLLVDVTAVTDDARTLFLQAARRLRPDFAITAENLSALNHICQLVGGMPLALELAAAWVDLLTLPEIAAEIQRNLEFLESDLRDVPSRHCSMQAVFDASWQRLSPAEQQLLTQVTIFKGALHEKRLRPLRKPRCAIWLDW